MSSMFRPTGAMIRPLPCTPHWAPGKTFIISTSTRTSGVVCAVKHRLCAGAEPMGERQELQPILLFDEHLARRLDQLQLLLLAPSRMRVEKLRLERMGLSASTCGDTNP